jgi:hypothetical protein
MRRAIADHERKLHVVAVIFVVGVEKMRDGCHAVAVNHQHVVTGQHRALVLQVPAAVLQDADRDQPERRASGIPDDPGTGFLRVRSPCHGSKLTDQRGRHAAATQIGRFFHLAIGDGSAMAEDA